MATSRVGRVEDVRAALPSRDDGQRLVIEELGGSLPIRIELQGSFGLEVGSEWLSEVKGETRVPMGSSSGYSSLLGRSWGDTEMTLALDAQFLRRRDIAVQNATTPFTPEDVVQLFERLQDRGRACLVQLGAFSRRGVLRKAVSAPGRGYSVDFGTGELTAPGMNVALRLTWEWSGRGAPGPAPQPPATGADVAGQLGAADSAYGLALADAGDAFAPDALTAISAAIGRVRGAISQLRRSVRQLGSLVAAPARLANEALAAARSLGNVLSDCETLIGDTRDAYLAAGAAAKGVGRSLGSRPSALARAAKAKGAIRDANQQAMDAVCNVFDAIARRQRRRVSVRPGQSLGDVARTQLGSADRWTDIARLNNLSGQVVPPGVTEVELPGGAS